ncbi:MAG: formate dehydrogenase subunit gamma [Mycobacteriales bacterium]
MVLTATGLALYLPTLSLLIGRRPLVEGLHVLAGFLLPLPVFAAWLSPAFRADMTRLNRFVPVDWLWLRNRNRRHERLPVGKFNAGQKLAAAAFAAAGAVLFGTGIMLLLPSQLALSNGLREGATIVHDVTTLALITLLLGHAALAYRYPQSRRALRTGSMDLAYAQRNYAQWARETQRRGHGAP